MNRNSRFNSPYAKAIPREEVVHMNTQVSKVLGFVWLGLKILVVVIIVFPFIDKLRHKDLFGKAINLVNEYDIGCKPCICQFNGTYN